MNKEKKKDNFDSAAAKISCLALALSLVVTGFMLDSPQNILSGLMNFPLHPDVLLSDYFVIGGAGAAFVNAGIVTFISICLTFIIDTTYSGSTIAMIYLMAGFALFGKNPFNILPFFAGVWLYSRHVGRPMRKYTNAALFSTTLSPFVTTVFLYRPFNPVINVLLAFAVGAFIGYIIIPLAEHTFSSHMGYSLFNYGFAGGLLALVLTSVLRAVGNTVETASIWNKGVPVPALIYVMVLTSVLIISGLILCKGEMKRLLALFRHSGQSPSDFVNTDGIGPVLINMGLMGLVCLSYILLIGGDLNGPVLGAILTSVGFAAAGEHPKNSIPVIVGVYLASVFIVHDAHAPSVQLAALFGTALAPISGQFGAVYGIAAGFLHTCVVLAVGPLCGGYNLYNNGFAAGLVAFIMVAVIQDLLNRKPKED